MNWLLNEDLYVVGTLQYLEQRNSQKKLKIDSFSFICITLTCRTVTYNRAWSIVLYCTTQSATIKYSTVEEATPRLYCHVGSCIVSPSGGLESQWGVLVQTGLLGHKSAQSLNRRIVKRGIYMFIVAETQTRGQNHKVAVSLSA